MLMSAVCVGFKPFILTNIIQLRSRLLSKSLGNLCVIFICVRVGQNVRPLNRHEYILDVATEAEAVDTSYSFWFRRVVWTQPLAFENEFCVATHFNQVTRLEFHTRGARYRHERT